MATKPTNPSEPKSLTSKIKDRFGVDLYAKYKNAKYKKKS